MLRNRLAAAAITAVLSVLPLSELYAACRYEPIMGGELRTCSNGTCWSQSVWSDDNQLISVVRAACDGNPPPAMT